MTTARRRAGLVCLWIATFAVAGWSLGAFRYQLDAPLRLVAGAAGAGLILAVLSTARRHRGRAWLMLGAWVAALVLWWSTILPSAERDWAPDVARGVTAEIGPDTVVLHDIRDFDWQDRDHATPRWTRGTYPLDAITSVDLVTSVWSSPAIAHVLVSFGFADGRHVVFSAEIRRERGESFSNIGGFFREFELVLIAAEERDILRLRTDLRGEQVSVFPLGLTPAQARALFLSYARLGNALDAEPEWYQTLTTNCTTVVFRLARLLDPGLPLDWRILASGYVPDYLHDLGVLDPALTMEEIRALALVDPDARPTELPYSRGIRAHWPTGWSGGIAGDAAAETGAGSGDARD